VSAGAPVPLHRHQLVRLGDEGWRQVLTQPWDEAVQPCLAHWAAQRLPLVVTRQPAGAAAPPDEIAVGLAAPERWQRRRIALSVPRRHVAWFDEFPLVDRIASPLPARARDWRRLGLSLKSLGTAARVYGSQGWQALTGLPCVHARSDIDLWVAVADAAQADAVAALFTAFEAAAPAPRLDGELLFPSGHAVAWREWQHWRAHPDPAGRSILAKTLTGAMLIRGTPAGLEHGGLVCAPW
jgi:phosphoribosyl-dephospho-CoA transferase